MESKERGGFDRFIEKVRPDPNSGEEIVVLSGFVGPSSLEGHIRLYADEMLSDGIDLPQNEILHREAFSKEENALGGSRLWVRKSAVFTVSTPGHANNVRSSFFEGDLEKAFGGASPSLLPTTLHGIFTSRFPTRFCPPWISKPFVCRTRFAVRSCYSPCIEFVTRQRSCIAITCHRLLCEVQVECQAATRIRTNPTDWIEFETVRYVNPTRLDEGGAGYRGEFDPSQGF